MQQREQDIMSRVFTGFSELLEIRLRRAVPTTEDSVRYTLFASMLRNDIEPDAVVLEFPHPDIPRAKIDTWLPDSCGKPVAIEFKYDRKPKGGKNPPKTQKAGALFADLSRLQLLSHRATAYLVYLTDSDMDIYFRNPDNNHREFYELTPGSSLEIGSPYFADKPCTFQRAAGAPFEVCVTAVLGRRFSGHCLKVYIVDQI